MNRQPMARRLAFAGTLVALANACGPDGCIPPSSGPDFEVDVGGNEIWSYGAVVQLDDYAFENGSFSSPPGHAFPVLPNPGATVSFKFRDIGETILSQFASNDPASPPMIFRTQPELHLFARDPRELYITLTTHSWTTWAATLRSPSIAGINSTPFELPADVVVPFGEASSPGAEYPDWVSSSVGWQDFWRSEADGTAVLNFNGPAAAPSPAGSLKAARILTLPECSRAIPFKTFYDRLSQEIDSNLSCIHSSTPFGDVNVNVELVGFVATPYLYHYQPPNDPRTIQDIAAQTPTNPIPEEGVVGGMLVGGQFHLSGTAPIIDTTPCDVTFKYDIRFTLDADGLLALDPRRLQLDATTGSFCNGAGLVFSGGKAILGNLFERQIPMMIHRIAQEEQALLPAHDSTFNPSGTINPFTCPYPSFSHDDDYGACGLARLALAQAVNAGATALGRPKDAATLLPVIDNAQNWYCRAPTEAEFNNTESTQGSCQSDSDCTASKCIDNQCSYVGCTSDTDCGAPLSNSKCSGGNCSDLGFCASPPPMAGIQGRCEFVIPAERIIVEPDEIRLGWPEILAGGLSNSPPNPTPSTVAFYAAAALGQTSSLCSPAHPSCVPPVNGSCPAGFEMASWCTDPAVPCSESVTSAHPFYHRYFATTSLSGRECRPRPDPPLQCGCSSDSQCAVGDFCDDVLHVCQHACETDSDCQNRLIDRPTTCTSSVDCESEPCVNNSCVAVRAGAACWTDIHLCASGRVGAPNCFPWEEQGPDGTCVERP